MFVCLVFVLSLYVVHIYKYMSVWLLDTIMVFGRCYYFCHPICSPDITWINTQAISTIFCHFEPSIQYRRAKVFTELNKIDIYVFITSKPPYNTGEPKCSQNCVKISKSTPLFSGHFTEIKWARSLKYKIVLHWIMGNSYLNIHAFQWVSDCCLMPK